MAYCPYCGQIILDNVKYCTYCGSALTEAQPAAQTAEQPAAQPVQPAVRPEKPMIPVYEPVKNPVSEPVMVYDQEPEVQAIYQEPEYLKPVIQPPKTPYNRCCLVGFILSIAGWGCLGLTSPFGLILSIIGLFTYGKKRVERGKGIAIAGIILSSIVILAIVFSWDEVVTDIGGYISAFSSLYS